MVRKIRANKISDDSVSKLSVASLMKFVFFFFYSLLLALFLSEREKEERGTSTEPYIESIFSTRRRKTKERLAGREEEQFEAHPFSSASFVA